MTQESPVSPKAAIHDTEVRMVTIGVDAHKRVHVAVALDAAGRQLGVWKGPNSSRAWQELNDWAAAFGGQRVWGVEGAWSYGRGLAQHLVVGGQVVYEVNSRWTALGRRSARKRGKTDRLDARSVAALVRQEAATLPRRRRQEGKTTREAFRALKRYIVRAIWRLWQICPGAVRREVVASAAA